MSDMIEARSTKERAKRVDPRYVRWWRPLATVRAGLSVIAIVAAAGAWMLIGGKRRQAALLPAPVSAAHAMWQFDCGKCHDNDGKGGYRKAVSDRACLQCHNAPMHDSDQLLRKGKKSRNPLAMAVMNGKTMRSADCVACHVEHQGREALAAVDNAICTKCHRDLSPAMQSGKAIVVADHVTAFDAKGDHPYFGRELSRSSLPRPPSHLDWKQLVDSTPLRFNHKLHMDNVAADASGENCSTCHVPESNGRYMRPISYEKDCHRCHQLTPVRPADAQSGPKLAALVHGDMGAAVDQMSNLQEMNRQWLARRPEELRSQILGNKTIEEWVNQSVEQTIKEIGEWQFDPGQIKKDAPLLGAKLEQLQDTMVGADDTEKAKIAALPEIIAGYVAYGMHYSCKFCHNINEIGLKIVPATTLATQSATTEATTQPTPPGLSVLQTVATGISEQPRRWFTHSRFDHRTHQNGKCTSCHSQAAQSSDTPDILSPNLTWSDAAGPRSESASCVQCHHPPSAQGRGATVSCISCHSFHDKSVPGAPAVRQSIAEIVGGGAASAKQQR